MANEQTKTQQDLSSLQALEFLVTYIRGKEREVEIDMVRINDNIKDNDVIDIYHDFTKTIPAHMVSVGILANNAINQLSPDGQIVAIYPVSEEMASSPEYAGIEDYSGRGPLSQCVDDVISGTLWQADKLTTIVDGLSNNSATVHKRANPKDYILLSFLQHYWCPFIRYKRNEG